MCRQSVFIQKPLCVMFWDGFMLITNIFVDNEYKPDGPGV